MKKVESEENELRPEYDLSYERDSDRPPTLLRVMPNGACSELVESRPCLSMKTNYSQRLMSARWFMLAGGIPGVCIIVYDLTLPYRNPGLSYPKTSMLFLLVLYVVVPAFLAAISGLLIGADILNPNKVLSARQAAARGLYVSLAAWVAFVPIVSLVMGSNLPFLNKLFLVLLGGSIIVGWLIVLVGMATGLFLYRFRKLQNASEEC